MTRSVTLLACLLATSITVVLLGWEASPDPSPESAPEFVPDPVPPTKAIIEADLQIRAVLTLQRKVKDSR